MNFVVNDTKIDIIGGALVSNIRGGGNGNFGAWIAEITGTDPKFKFSREFCDKDTSNISRSGKSGYIAFKITKPGVYQYAKLGSSKVSSGATISGYFQVHDNCDVAEITENEVRAYLNGK